MEPTLRVDVDDLLNDMSELITFHVVGMTISILMQWFCTALGLYEEYEMEDPVYDLCPRQFPICYIVA